MTNKTQARIADWAMTVALASVVLPLVGLLVLSGARSSFFWLKCVGLAGFAVVAIWMLNENRKGDCRYRTFAWVVALAYFSVVLVSVEQFFESLQMTLIFGAPEVIGVVLCLVGLVHSIRITNVPEELKP